MEITAQTYVLQMLMVIVVVKNVPVHRVIMFTAVIIQLSIQEVRKSLMLHHIP